MRISPDLIARAMRVPRLDRTEAKEPDPPKRPTDRVAFVAGLVERRDAATASLEQVKALRGKALDRAIAASLAALRERTSGAVPEIPGALVVRVVGRTRAARTMRPVPIAGVTVRLAINGDRAVIERESDDLGVVVFDPAESEGQPPSPRPDVGEIQVLAPDRAVLGRRRVTAAEMKSGMSTVIEIAETPSIAGAFAKAERWTRAEDAAAEKADALRTLLDKALPQLDTELKTIRSGLDTAIEAASGSKKSKRGGARRRTPRRDDA